MIMTYEEAKKEFESMKDRPSLDEFINFAKTNFIFLDVTFGAGFVLHAIEIAEKLKEVTE